MKGIVNVRKQIRSALRKMKIGRVTRMGEIVARFLKKGREELVEFSTRLDVAKR